MLNISSLIKYVTKPDAFLKQVYTLMTGTVLAQVIMVTTVPLLTRLYTPNDYGTFALFTAIQAILTIVATGKYELAIYLPQVKKDALALVILGLILCLGFSVSTLVLFVIFSNGISGLIKSPDIQPWLALISVAVFFTGMYQILYSWFNRTQQYQLMSRSKMLLAIVTVITSIILGIHCKSMAGLVIGSIAGKISVALMLLYVFLRQEKRELYTVSKQQVLQLGRRYINFPKYFVLSYSINTGASQLPVILLNIFFGSTVVGYFSLAQMVSVPFGLIGQSVGDVFRQLASAEYKVHEKCPNVYRKTFKTLAWLGIAPCVILFLTAPELFKFIFGENWLETGKYIQILSILFYFQLVASPLTIMFMVAEKQRSDLLFQLFMISVGFCTLYGGYLFFQEPVGAIFLYSIGCSGAYLINLLLTSRWAGVELFAEIIKKKG